jgi:hypothetical protein
MISQTNFTSNLTESIYNKLVTIVGTTFTHSTLGAKTITYVGGYPPDITAYKSLLPIIILDRSERMQPRQYEVGGRRLYTDNYYIDVIAGGYSDDIANAYMKNAIIDLIVFGFDLKRYDYTNYDQNVVQGQYQTTCREIPRVPSSQSSVYERHHAQILLTTTAVLSN